MDAPLRAMKLSVCLIFTWVASVFAANCSASEPCCCLHKYHAYFDGSTLAAWSRTWHGPYALATPISSYYVPRTPACGCHSNFAACANGCTFVNADESVPVRASSNSNGYAPACALNGGFPCAEGGFELLGRIPNDMAIASPLPVGAPTPPAR
jgi:hypothetical protein